MPDVKSKVFEIDRDIELTVVNEAKNGDTGLILKNMNHKELEERMEVHDYVEPYEAEIEMPKQYEFTEESYNQYITLQVIIPIDNGYGKSKVFGQKKDDSGNPIGSKKKNHLLDSMFYTVQFYYGILREYAVNIIAKNMYVRVDYEGQEHLIMSEIFQNWSDAFL